MVWNMNLSLLTEFSISSKHLTSCNSGCDIFPATMAWLTPPHSLLASSLGPGNHQGWPPAIISASGPSFNPICKDPFSKINSQVPGCAFWGHPQFNPLCLSVLIDQRQDLILVIHTLNLMLFH